MRIRTISPRRQTQTLLLVAAVVVEPQRASGTEGMRGTATEILRPPPPWLRLQLQPQLASEVSAAAAASEPCALRLGKERRNGRRSGGGGCGCGDH